MITTIEAANHIRMIGLVYNLSVGFDEDATHQVTKPLRVVSWIDNESRIVSEPGPIRVVPDLIVLHFTLGLHC